MTDLRLKGLSLTAANYKCFGAEPCGFDQIRPINLLIGRNNSGKSSFLDLIKYATAPTTTFAESRRNGAVPDVTSTYELTADQVKKIYPVGGTGQGPYDKLGRQHVGGRLTCTFAPNGDLLFRNLNPPYGISAEQGQRMLEKIGHPLTGLKFHSLLAARDIQPEAPSGATTIEGNGTGATDLVSQFLNDVYRPSELIEKTILEELNKVFAPDERFTRILTQRLGDGRWEIHFEQPNKGRMALTNTGSGVKTIFLMLLFLHLLPVFENRSLNHYVFAFEEMENNLHPALERRVLGYLRDMSRIHNFLLFLTTHSHVAIDMFASDERAQILHVLHDGTNASVTRVVTYTHRQGILDDLDVRASDLLQANCVIWVEGPSDRTYVKRWIDEFSAGTLTEGHHYQCVFYGGKLLAHLSASAPPSSDDLVSILRLNAHAIVIIDSDRDTSAGKLSDAKERIVAEISGVGGVGWVTDGKEIENYLPSSAVTAVMGQPATQIDRYEDFSSYLDGIVSGEGRRFEKHKTMYAERFSSHLNKASLETILDLGQRMIEVCSLIRKWNGAIEV